MRQRPDEDRVWQRCIDERQRALSTQSIRSITDIDDWVALFLRHLQVSGHEPATVRGYYYFLRNFAKWSAGNGSSLARRVTREHVSSYLRYLIEERRVQRSTVRLYRIQLRVFFSFLQAQGFHSRWNPAAGIGFYSAQRCRVREVLSREQCLALVSAPRKILEATLSLGRLPNPRQRLVAARDTAILGLMLGSGLRRTEVAELMRDGLNLADGILQVRGKGRQHVFRTERQVFVHPLALEPLREYLALTDDLPSGRVFLGLGGQPMAPYSVGMLPVRYGRRALGRHVSAHLLRHTFATHLIQGGADPHSVQRLLGHKDITTTLYYYLHLTPDEVRAEWRAACPIGRART